MKLVLELPELDGYVKEAVNVAVRHVANGEEMKEIAGAAIREIVTENRDVIISTATEKCVKSIMARLRSEKEYRQAKEEYFK